MKLPKGMPLPKLNLSHKLHQNLLSKTGFHEETLARIGLTKSLKDYTEKTKFISEVNLEESSNHSSSAMQGLEFFSLCRSSMDIWAEYTNMD